MAAQSYVLKFDTQLGDSISLLLKFGDMLQKVVQTAVEIAQPFAAATAATNTLTDATHTATEAQEQAAEGQKQAAGPASTLATALQKVGEACLALQTGASNVLASVNEHIPNFVSHMAEAVVEVASFATGMGLVVTPLVLAGTHFGNAGVLAASAASSFLIFSSSAAGLRTVVHGLSETLGLTALRSAALARIGPLLLEWAPVAGVFLAVYTAVRLFAAGMDEAESQLANRKTIEKVTRDAGEAAKAFGDIKKAVLSTGLAADELTEAFLSLRAAKADSLLTAQGLKEVGGMALTAHKSVSEIAGKLRILYEAVREGGEDGQKATRAAVHALQEQGVFADKARDRIDALQSAHAKTADVLKVVRAEVAQYAAESDAHLNTVGGQWERLKTVTRQALGEAFTPLAELKAALEGLAADTLHRVADGVAASVNAVRGFLAKTATDIDELRVIIGTTDNFLEKFRGRCDELEREIRENLAGAITGLKATVEEWGTTFDWVFDAAVEKVDALLSKLSDVGSAIKGAYNHVVDAASDLIPDSWKGGGGKVPIPGLPDQGTDEVAIPGLPREGAAGMADDVNESYKTAQANLAASKATAKAAEDKAKAVALRKDADRMVTPKTYAEGTGATDAVKGNTAAVDEGAEAQKRYQMLLDETKGKLAVGDISHAEATEANIRITQGYIAQLNRLQAGLSPTSDKYHEMEVRILSAGAALMKLREGNEQYQAALALTKSKLDAGIISQSQANAENNKTIGGQIANLRALQGGVSQTSAAYQKWQTQINNLSAQRQQTTFLGNLRLQLRQLGNDWTNLSDKAGAAAVQIANTISSSIGNAITGLISGTTTWKDAFMEAGKSVIATLIQMAVQYVLGRAIMVAVNIGGGAAEASAASGMASTAAAAWAAAGTAASIATYGTAAGVGLAAYLSAMSTGVATTTALGSVGGYEGGGLVPGAPSHKDNILAKLATGEFVIKTAAVQHWGVDFLQMLNSLSTPRMVLPAYAAGGLVGSAAAVAAATGGNGGRGRIVNNVKVGSPKVTLIQPNTRYAMHEAMQSAEGDRIIIDAVNRNKRHLGIRS